jgi:hypothetical protein
MEICLSLCIIGIGLVRLFLMCVFLMRVVNRVSLRSVCFFLLLRVALLVSHCLVIRANLYVYPVDE